MDTTLRIERRDQADLSIALESEEGTVVIAPVVGEDYWTYRVGLSEAQALIGFPKFGLIGIGYAVERADVNANLPYGTHPVRLLRHIAHNADPNVPDELVLEAIRMIREAAVEDGHWKACMNCAEPGETSDHWIDECPHPHDSSGCIDCILDYPCPSVSP